MAILVVSSFDVTPSGMESGHYRYMPSLVLTETSGMSMATVQRVWFTMPSGEAFTFSGNCFLPGPSNVVAAGGDWNVNNVASYCLDLYSPGEIAGRRVEVRVEFADEQGRGGVATGSATVGSS